MAWSQSRLDKGIVTDNTVLREMKTYKKYLQESEFHKRLVRTISQEEWSEFLEGLYPGMTAKEWGRIKGVVKSIVSYARRAKLITYNAQSVLDDICVNKGAFAHKISNPDNEIYFKDEWEKLFDYCAKHIDDPYIRCFLFERIIGARPGELCAVTAEDIDLDSMTLFVRQTETRALKDGKVTGKQYDTVRAGTKNSAGIRKIILPDTARPFVQYLLDIATASGGGYLFKQEAGRFKTRYVGHRIRARQLSRHLKKICEDLNIPYKSLHKIRKTYASILNSSGTEKQLILSLMGHTDIRTTLRFYIRDRERTQERSRMLGEIPELQIPVPESSTDACDSKSHIKSHMTDLL